MMVALTAQAMSLRSTKAVCRRTKCLESQGILTVRFEMPFAVWCEHCKQPTIIGQGVRFNAEKRKVGAYHSTPIWAFRMKHSECGGWLEIRTDPANTDYVVFEGGRRRDTGGADDEGDLEITTEEEKRRAQQDAFAALEVTINDRRQAEAEKTRVDELLDASNRDWSDPFSANKRLRSAFRVERKELEKKAKANEELKDRMSLGIDLLDESEEDRVRAMQVTFGEDAAAMDAGLSGNDSAALDQRTISRAEGKQLFNTKLPPSKTESTSSSSSKSSFKSSRKAKAKTVTDAAAAAKLNLRSELRSNTRAALDVFGSLGSGLGSGSGSNSQGTMELLVPGLKRKRDSTKTNAATANASAIAIVTKVSKERDRDHTEETVNHPRRFDPRQRQGREEGEGEAEAEGEGVTDENQSSAEADLTMATNMPLALVEYESD